MDMNRKCVRDFPGHPGVKNLPSNAGDSHSALVWELRSHIPHGNRAHGLNGDRLWGHKPQLERSLCTAMKDPSCHD